MDREFVVPVCFIIGFVQVESIVVHSFVMPVTHLVEKVHVFSDDVSVDHVEVQDLVLLVPALPGGTPVIVFSDGDHALNRHVGSLHSTHTETFES